MYLFKDSQNLKKKKGFLAYLRVFTECMHDLSTMKGQKVKMKALFLKCIFRKP